MNTLEEINKQIADLEVSKKALEAEQAALLSLSKAEHNKELTRLVKAAEDALAEATNYATLHKLSFSWEPAYGMGGTFGEKKDYYNSDGEEGEWDWTSSSEHC